jgi:hypothetical protein
MFWVLVVLLPLLGATLVLIALFDRLDGLARQLAKLEARTPASDCFPTTVVFNRTLVHVRPDLKRPVEIVGLEVNTPTEADRRLALEQVQLALGAPSGSPPLQRGKASMVLG